MKRLVTVAGLLLISSVTAFADTSLYISRPEKSDADLQRITEICDQQIGVVRDGAIPSAAYKKCMRHYGWFYQKTVHAPHEPRERTWIDPETGDTCRSFMGGALCGNF